MKLSIISIILLIAYACSPTSHSGHEHDHGHGEQHEDPNFEILYTQHNIEWYISYPPAIVGETTTFKIYARNTRNNNPAEINALQLSVANNNSVKAEAPLKAGTVELPLHFTNKGRYSAILEYESKGEKYRIAAGKITVFESHEKAHEQLPQPDKEAISYPIELQWQEGFSLEQTELKTFNEVVPCSGELLPSVDNEIGIIAQAPGIITISKNLLPGRQINQGERIAAISGQVLDNDITARYNSALAEFEQAKRQFDRSKQLADKQLVSVSDLEDSEAELKKTEAQFNSIAKNYSPEGKSIVAPSDGTIAKVLVGEGDYVQAGQLLAKIHVESSFMLRADVPKYYADRLSSITDANFTPEYSDKTTSVIGLGGQRIATEIITDDKSAYIPVFFHLPPSPGIIPHSYAECYLTAQSKQKEISVPNESIMESEGSYWVYVRTGGETFEKRNVAIGISDGKKTVIKSGLTEHETVACKGAYRLKLASMSAEVPEHTH